jgi:hypothetical protein
MDDGRYWAGSVGDGDLHIMDEGLATKVQFQTDATIWRVRVLHAVTDTMDCGFKELSNKANADLIGSCTTLGATNGQANSYNGVYAMAPTITIAHIHHLSSRPAFPSFVFPIRDYLSSLYFVDIQ